MAKGTLNVCPNITSSVEPGPLIRLNVLPEECDVSCEVLAKCEFFNYGQSFESRSAQAVIQKLEASGSISPETTLVFRCNVPFAVAAILSGYKCAALVDDSADREMVNLVQALGVKVLEDVPIVTNAGTMFGKSYLVEEIFEAKVLHEMIEEILDACEQQLDMLVFDGTYGDNYIETMTRIVTELCPSCEVVATVFEGSFIGIRSSHAIPVNSVVAVETTKELIAKEALLCGQLSGAVVSAGLRAAKKLDESRRCVFLLADGLLSFMHSLAPEKPSNTELKLASTSSWLWKVPVETIISNINRVHINSTTSCFDAIRMMRRCNLSQLPVVHPTNSSFLGVLAASEIVNKITTKILHSDIKCSSYLRNDYPKMKRTDSIGWLLILLQVNPFVVVVEKISANCDQFVCIIRNIDAVANLCLLNRSEK